MGTVSKKFRQKVLALKAEGMYPDEIAKALGCNEYQVLLALGKHY